MQTSCSKRLLLVVITGAVCALATSCGGGGGSGDSSQAPALPTVTAVWDTPAASWDNVIWQ